MKKKLTKLNNYYYIIILSIVFVAIYLLLSFFSFFNIKTIDVNSIKKHNPNELKYNEDYFSKSKLFYSIYNSVTIKAKKVNYINAYYILKKENEDKYYKLRTNMMVEKNSNNEKTITLSTRILRYNLSGNYELYIYSDIDNKQDLVNVNKEIEMSR